MPRPLSLALLTGFLFVFFYLSYCDKRCSEKSGFSSIVFSQYLFVMSVGLQPVVLIISFFISSFWLFFYKKKQIFKNLFASHLITAFFTLPFYMKMYFYAQSFYKFKTISLTTISSYIMEYNIFKLFKKYFFLFYEQMIPLFLLVAVSWGIVVFMKKKTSSLAIITSSTLILFPLLYDFIFHTVINWPFFNNWYFIVLSLGIIFFVVLALREIHQYLATVKWKFLWWIPMTILFLWSSYLQISAIKNDTQFRWPYMANDMEKVYGYLESRGNSNDLALDFSLNSILDSMRKDLYRNKILFYKPDTHPKIVWMKYLRIKDKLPKKPYSFKIYYIDRRYFLKNIKQKIFFVVDDIKGDIFERKAYNVLAGFMEGHRFGQYVVFELVLKEKNKEKEYIRFLSDLIERTPKKQSSILYETLLYYACENKNIKQFRRLLKEYKKLEIHLQEIAPKYEFPRYFELKRRVKHFESANCNGN